MSIEKCGDLNRGSNGNAQLAGLGQSTLVLVWKPYPDTNIVLRMAGFSLVSLEL
jgi:hypothetical protein